MGKLGLSSGKNLTLGARVKSLPQLVLGFCQFRAVARRSTQESEKNLFSVLMFLAGTGLCNLTSA